MQATFASVFRELLRVDEQGVATRRRALIGQVGASHESKNLVDKFVKARLMVTGRGKDIAPTVEVAHEALLTYWERLAEWIKEWRDDLRLRDQVDAAAKEWQHQNQDPAYLWLHERLQPVYAMFKRLSIDEDDMKEPLKTFVSPESKRLLQELENPQTSHYRRAEIGDRLNQIGDPRFGIGVNKGDTADRLGPHSPREGGAWRTERHL